jgi:hypothetical protein
MRVLSLLLLTLTTTTAATMILGCDTPDGVPQDTGESGGSESGESGGSETGNAAETESGNETGDPEQCNEPLPDSVIDHDVRFSGFPEVDGTTVVDSNGFNYMGTCTVLSAGPVGPANEVVLACEHPNSDTAEVTLALDGVALPAGLEIAESVEFRVSSAVNVGGLVAGLDVASPTAGSSPRLLTAGEQYYEIHDAQGLVFAAMHGLAGFEADYGELTLELADACPSYEFGDTDIAAFFRASTSEASVDVEVGESKSVTLGSTAWDVRTFKAQRSCCHGDLGDVRVLRTAL